MWLMHSIVRGQQVGPDLSRNRPGQHGFHVPSEQLGESICHYRDGVCWLGEINNSVLDRFSLIFK